MIFEVCGCRCHVPRGLMGARVIVEAEVLGQSLFRLCDIPIRFQVDVLILDRAPQAFGKDVVHAASPSVHADLNVLVGEQISVAGRGKV